MLRRSFILILAVVAITMALAGTIGYVVPVYVSAPFSPKKQWVLQFFDGRVRVFRFYSESHDFKVVQRERFRRVLEVSAQNRLGEKEPQTPTWIERLVRSPNLHAVPVHETLLPLPRDLAGPAPPNEDWAASVRIGNQRTVPDFGYGWEGRLYSDQQLYAFRTNGVGFAGPLPLPAPWFHTSYIRMPVWLPAGLLLLLPVRSAFRMTRHRARRRRNECIDCGYNLTGLVSPRCPECGSEIGSSATPILGS